MRLMSCELRVVSWIFYPLLVRHGRRGVSAEAIGTSIHPPLQVAIADEQHPNQHELQDLYYQPNQY